MHASLTAHGCAFPPSPTAVFAYDPPEVTRLKPNCAPMVGVTTVTLSGRNFGGFDNTASGGWRASEASPKP